eukprot:2241561-Rhodomonas_salina.6
MGGRLGGRGLCDGDDRALVPDGLADDSARVLARQPVDLDGEGLALHGGERHVDGDAVSADDEKAALTVVDAGQNVEKDSENRMQTSLDEGALAGEHVVLFDGRLGGPEGSLRRDALALLPLPDLPAPSTPQPLRSECPRRQRAWSGLTWALVSSTSHSRTCSAASSSFTCPHTLSALATTLHRACFGLKN